MRKVTQDEFNKAVKLHEKWFWKKPNGVQMDFSCCDLTGIIFQEDMILQGANFHAANLSHAVLRLAELTSADLTLADLSFANLNNAFLNSADLSYANMTGARLLLTDLRHATLNCVNLKEADFYTTNIQGASFCNACIQDGIQLVGERPVLIIGPMGSRKDYLTVFLTNCGIYLQTGCFLGTVDEFITELDNTYEWKDKHNVEYRAAIAMARTYAKAWTPAE